MTEVSDAIKHQCAHFGGALGQERCLIGERNWSPGSNPARCPLCPDAASPSPTGEKVEAVAWQHRRRVFRHGVWGIWSEWLPGMADRQHEGTLYGYEDRALVPAATLAALEAERDEALKLVERVREQQMDQWERTNRKSCILAEALDKAERERDDALADLKSSMGNTNAAIDDYNDALAQIAAANARVERYRTALHKIDMLDEAMGHELRESHAFEAVAIARAALTGGEGTKP